MLEHFTLFHQSADLIVTGRSIPSTTHLRKNEDTMLYLPYARVAMILDGSSGSIDGQLASRKAAFFLAEHLGQRDGNVSEVKRELKDALVGASEYIQQVAPDCLTTAVVVKIVNTRRGKTAVFGHVGDSRGYVFGSNRLLRVTNDHNLIYASTIPPEEKDAISSQLDQMRTYEQLRELKQLDPKITCFFYNQNWVVQILGEGKSILPEKFPIPLQRNRKLTPRIRAVALEPTSEIVLTSDGVHENLTISQMEHILKTSKRFNLGISLVRKAAQIAREWKEIRAVEDDMTAVVISQI